MSTTAATPADRDRRVEDIHNGALVRRLLGQAARHHRLDDGQHEVVLHGERFIAPTLEQAIDLCNWARDHSGAGE